MMNQTRGLTDTINCLAMESNITENLEQKKSGAKEKHQLNPGGPSNRQDAPAPTN